MRCTRPLIAADAALFGRKGVHSLQDSKESLSNDLRLFLTTFAAGFAFVSLMIA